MFGDARLDLSQLDAEAADLDLEVVAAEVFDVAVRQPAAEVAGLVHPAAGERILEEPLGGKVVAVEIAARDAGAADVDLPHHARRHELAVRVEDVDRRVGYGTTDVGHEAFAPRHRHPRGVGRRLRGPVEVAERLDRGRGEDLLGQRPLERLACEVDGADRRGHRVRVDQSAHRRGDGVDEGDLHRLLDQLQRVAHDHYRRAHAERDEQLEHGEVEVQRGREERPRQLLGREGGLPPADEVDGVAMLEGDALRLARRARGVDDVGEARRHRRRVRIRLVFRVR
jgi:hypothetical protein